jgi:hypothetical protein
MRGRWVVLEKSYQFSARPLTFSRRRTALALNKLLARRMISRGGRLPNIPAQKRLQILPVHCDLVRSRHHLDLLLQGTCLRC